MEHIIVDDPFIGEVKPFPVENLPFVITAEERANRLIQEAERSIARRIAGQTDETWLSMYRRMKDGLDLAIKAGSERALEIKNELFLQQTHPNPESNPDVDSYLNVHIDDLEDFQVYTPGKPVPIQHNDWNRTVSFWAIDAGEALGWDLKTRLDFIEANMEWAGVDNEEFVYEDRGYEPEYFKPEYDLDEQGFVWRQLRPHFDAFYEARNEVFKEPAYADRHQRFRKLMAPYIDALIDTINSLGAPPETLVWPISETMGKWRLMAQDVKRIKVPAGDGIANLYDYIREHGESIMEMLSERDPALLRDEPSQQDIYRTIERFRREILETFPEKGPVCQTRSFMAGVIAAVDAGRHDLSNAGWDAWRSSLSAVGQVAYRREYEKSKSRKKAMNAFIRAGRKAGDLVDWVMHCSPTHVTVQNFDGQLRQLDWGLFRFKTRNRECRVFRETGPEKKEEWARLMRERGLTTRDMALLKE